MWLLLVARERGEGGSFENTPQQRTTLPRQAQLLELNDAETRRTDHFLSYMATSHPPCSWWHLNAKRRAPAKRFLLAVICCRSQLGRGKRCIVIRPTNLVGRAQSVMPDLHFSQSACLARHTSSVSGLREPLTKIYGGDWRQGCCKSLRSPQVAERASCRP